ncbi:hypothetical protein C2G38_2180105 [Gigaspora rosea]|uniref:Uncharacterized protein n=1 Tax=Gigaspora rosea TaxID=44941 RepID=A0A397VJR5_9GLOM|nr:hypothetical protein C2G38_2180105 [Gigaspora rosea]
MQFIQDYYIKARGIKNLYSDPSTNLTWTPHNTGPEAMNLEEMYIVDDHWEIEAEERYLTATANHVTKGNRWYEEEEFEVYLAIAPNKTDPNETNAAPRDPTLNQSGAEKDQDNVTRRPILDKGFARRMEYQDLIIDMQEGGAGCIVVEEDLKPEYEEVPEELAGETNWNEEEKLEE